jgi:DNA-binding transcriptional MerR regulator
MYKIGEFSKLLNTTAKKIRYYDNEGILLPDYIDKSTGYRYYSCYKISEYTKVTTLKELGFSLNEIKQMMYEHSDESILSMIQTRKKEIIDELENINNRLLLIEEMEDEFTKLTDIYNDQSKYKNKVEVKENLLRFEFPDERSISVNYVCSDKSDLYYIIKFYLEVINGFGLVCYEYEAIRKLFTAGATAYLYKCAEGDIGVFLDEDSKMIALGFTVGREVSLSQINELINKHTGVLSNNTSIYFSVILDKNLGKRDIEVSLINIK